MISSSLIIWKFDDGRPSLKTNWQISFVQPQNFQIQNTAEFNFEHKSRRLQHFKFENNKHYLSIIILAYMHMIRDVNYTKSDQFH